LPWNGGLIAVNSFGFGGANAHILLRPNPKPKAPAIQDNIPRLVALSGRTEEAVNYFLDKVRITVCIFTRMQYLLFLYLCPLVAFRTSESNNVRISCLVRTVTSHSELW
jgi:hypothetical protein